MWKQQYFEVIEFQNCPFFRRGRVMELEEKDARVQTVYALKGEKLCVLREDLEHERAERDEQQDTERDVREKVVEERNQMVQRLEEQRLQQEVIEKRLISAS